MANRQAVELFPVKPPLGHEVIQDRYKARIVGWLDQVSQFVDHDVLQAALRLLCQIRIEADAF